VAPVSLDRGRLVLLAIAFIAGSLAAMLGLDVPSDGIAYFAFLPIALVALAAGPLWGSVAAVLTGVTYTLLAAIDVAPVSREQNLTTTAVRVLAQVAVAVLIGRFSQEQRGTASRLEALANRDSLTGLLNPRAYDRALSARCAAGRTFTLILCDMDGLKQVNDSLGHAAGNDALHRLALTLADAVRGDDDVARIGGDEFSILAAGATANDAAALCARLQRDLVSVGLSASFGWAVFPDNGSDAAALFRCADERLYDGKRFRKRAAEPRAERPREAPDLGIERAS
jgi:diguanylate cyclase (GGDEF)-like protein